MTVIDIIALFGIMLGLSALPSSSVALVVGRAATLDVANGIAVAMGIVLGDLVFIALAILGLSFVAETMGTFFVVIKYLGAAYLIWLGITLLRSKSQARVNLDRQQHQSNLLKSLFAGFFLTLGDIKAIIFYASLFPAFLDLTVLSMLDILIIVVITVLTVGGVKIAYAFAANKIVTLTSGESFVNTVDQNVINRVTGTLMIGAGGLLITKA